MSIDLSTMSREDLEELSKDVEVALVEVADRQRKAALEALEQTATAHGFDLTELTTPLTNGARVGIKGKSKNPPKYRNPEDPKQTWTGRGRKPSWIKAAESAGKDLAEYEI